VPADRTHEFARRLWSPETGLLLSAARLLTAPAAVAYRIGIGARNALYDNKIMRITSCKIPVVSVGSVMVGGAGKTPIAGWLAGWLLQKGRRVALLHGGYARDEPELHRRWHPQLRVYAQKDRIRSAAQAVADGAEILILDDGFQHRRLHRDVDLVLVPAEPWAQSHRLLPRGPYREPESALRRAHVLLVTRKTASPEEADKVAQHVRARVGGNLVIGVASIRPGGWTWRGQRTDPPGEAVLVAAIAQPELFAANVRESGVQVFDRLWFPDHHEYDARDAERIYRAAGRLPIITTAKDALKLEPLIRDRLWVLEQEVRMETGAADLMRCLEERLGENDRS
jgi:tetraacyldisaccharide 4'-kinase